MKSFNIDRFASIICVYTGKQTGFQILKRMISVFVVFWKN